MTGVSNRCGTQVDSGPTAHKDQGITSTGISSQRRLTSFFARARWSGWLVKVVLDERLMASMAASASFPSASSPMMCPWLTPASSRQARFCVFERSASCDIAHPDRRLKQCGSLYKYRCRAQVQPCFVPDFQLMLRCSSMLTSQSRFKPACRSLSRSQQQLSPRTGSSRWRLPQRR